MKTVASTCSTVKGNVADNHKISDNGNDAKISSKAVDGENFFVQNSLHVHDFESVIFEQVLRYFLSMSALEKLPISHYSRLKVHVKYKNGIITHFNFGFIFKKVGQ